MLSPIEDAVRRRAVIARTAAGKDRQAIADGLGMPYQSYSHYERGRYAFTIAQVHQLAPLLGCTAGHLLGIESGLSPAEDRLLAFYRRLAAGRPEAAAGLLAAAEAMAGA